MFRYKKRFVRKRRYPARRKPAYRPRYGNRSYRGGKVVASPFQRTLGTLPERLFVKMRYADNYTATVTANVLNALAYYRTSTYAPRSAGGHQPMFRDQYSLLYGSYRVYGIKYKIVIANESTDEGFIAAVRHQDSYTADNDLQTLLERADTKWQQRSSRNGGKNMAYFTGYLDTAKTVGYSKRNIKYNDSFSAIVGADPSKMAYLMPYIDPMGSTTNRIFEVTVYLTYYVEFFNQQLISGS